ncbi:MAG TPA: hypothetical protein VJT49_05335 [Amycolatopsis sp.]|uniref:hypothetical protein n=1 Tax=Amycolatopsis sp. TaxID=37632 RepID=UPI002B4A319E|nr:hypothetical protein [Amycolatopsis sp.]HKS44529.1 hypothetical protein [Amycolatopsis sp.]
MLALSGRYGYFGDELRFLAAGRHLAWGYADQLPALPLRARAMDALAPGSVTVPRLPAIIATVAGIVVAALIAREPGGARRGSESSESSVAGGRRARRLPAVPGHRPLSHEVHNGPFSVDGAGVADRAVAADEGRRPAGVGRGRPRSRSPSGS